jgi:hypothetical protein
MRPAGFGDVIGAAGPAEGWAWAGSAVFVSWVTDKEKPQRMSACQGILAKGIVWKKTEE